MAACIDDITGRPWFRDLFRRKSIHSVMANLRENAMHQTLSLWSLVSLGIGSVVGAGIFVVTGQVAAKYAGPALSLSFCISAVACFFTGMCYAELSACLPIAGSAYSYIYVSMGEVVAWVVAVCLTLEYMVAAAAVSVGWSASVQDLLREINVTIPHVVGRSPFALDDEGALYATGAVVNLPAVFIIALLTVILCLGVKESARFNSFTVVLKLTVLMIFVGYGIYFAVARNSVFVDNLTPFIPENQGRFGKFGVSGIFRGAGAIFFAYVGFDCVCSVAQECKNPERDLPRGLLIVLVACTLLYVAVTVSLTGMANYTLMNVDDPVIFALAQSGAGPFFRIIVEIGTVAGLTSVCLVSLLSMPRLIYAIAMDGLLPPSLHVIHERFRTPFNASVYCGALTCLLCGLLPLDVLGEIVSFGTLVAFICVCLGVIVLRRTEPEHPRPFRVAYVPLVPALGVVSCVVQLFSLPPQTWLNYSVLLSVGGLVYAFYGRHHSKLGRVPHPGLDGDEIELGEDRPAEAMQLEAPRCSVACEEEKEVQAADGGERRDT